ncbi:MAG: AAA family ATPase [Candidatus Aegiribacteria sp.]|nr:AAA family ATPase [Candidatus Aegiribacteria sp.]
MKMFVNRKNELEELRALSQSKQPVMALLYGRRRVGKTYLLGRVWKDPFYFLAADTTLETNRTDLLRELEQWSGMEIFPEDYHTWRSVFRLMARIAGEKQQVFILDEFQYLLERDSDVVSQLTAVWDREMDDSPLVLVLCGSEVSTMEALQSRDSPLFGRLSWSSRLRPFDYFDSSRMLPWLPLREAMYIYGALGGMPRYLSAVKHNENLRESLCRILLSPRGEVHIQLQNLMAGEKGIRNTAEYDAVLRAVAAGRRELSEIASCAGLQDRTYVARRVLEVMENLALIRRERNYGASSKSPWRYRIADNALLFWHRFIEPNRSQLERDMVGSVWETSIEPLLDTYMGHIFEDIARQTLLRFSGELGLPVLSTCNRWEGLDRNRRSIELDIVARLKSGEMLTGEVKWSSSPVDPDVHFQLLRNLEDLTASGQNWAKQALGGWFVYFSAAGFSEYMLRLAEDTTRVILVSLEDMFPD